jgi:23S rRNA pseudouridine1911/1915/1917 synthase
VIKLSAPATREFWEIPILYEDAQLLALDKPAGLPIAPDREDQGRSSLIGLLHRGIADAKPWATSRTLSYLMYAHRLDAEASGILLLAKNKAVLAKLLDLFGSQQAKLAFVALVQGASLEDQFSVDAKLATNRIQGGRMRVDAKFGKRAHTDFKVLERFAGWTLLNCFPLTHRPHQVRLHLGRAGFRVAGDEAYGGKPLWLSSLKPGYRLKPGHTERPLIGRACLHAESLSLTRPDTGEPLVVKAPWPKDLLVGIKYLRKYASA